MEAGWGSKVISVPLCPGEAFDLAPHAFTFPVILYHISLAMPRTGLGPPMTGYTLIVRHLQPEG